MGNSYYIEREGIPKCSMLLPENRAESLLKIKALAETDGSRLVVLEDFEPVYLGQLNHTKRLRVFREIIIGLLALHEEGKAYGWLSPAAIVICEGRYKLHRFASGTDLDYVAPEIIHHGEITPAADIYGLGRLLENYLPELKIWRDCVAENPARRPLMRAVLEHLNQFVVRAEKKAPSIWYFTPKTIGIVTLAFSALFVAFASQLSPIWKGYEVLVRQGPAAAYQYFDNLVRDKRSDDESLYLFAWSAFRVREFQQAEEIGRQLLLSKDPRVQANSFYLLGFVKSGTGRLNEAYSDFNEALVRYQDLGDDDNIHKTLLGLADLAMGEKDFGLAENFLNQAEFHGLENLNLGPYHYMRALISYKNGDYESALRNSILAAEEARGEGNNWGHALSTVGFYLILNGRLEEGRQKTQEAEIALIESLDRRGYYWNMLNTALYTKCAGGDYQFFIDQISRVAVGEEKLQDHLNFILSFNCDASRLGALAPAPPVKPPDSTVRTDGEIPPPGGTSP